MTKEEMLKHPQVAKSVELAQWLTTAAAAANVTKLQATVAFATLLHAELKTVTNLAGVRLDLQNSLEKFLAHAMLAMVMPDDAREKLEGRG